MLINTLVNILVALAAWRSGHRIRLRNRTPGFESSQLMSFQEKHSNAVLYNRLNLLKKRNKGIGQKNKNYYLGIQAIQNIQKLL
jgi:hypothetical protein